MIRPILASMGLAALGLTALPLPANAAGEVTEFTLDNGMQVVVIEDHRGAAVTHMVWYRAGSADEMPGQSGIAHFLEHLMFKATDDLESREFSRIVEENGGSDNAFTSWDYTAYHQRVSADRLGLMMMMEADRMRDLVLDEDEVRTERQVILEERAQRTDTSPGALFNEQMAAAIHLNHPYGRPIIGWRHEMEELSLQDARDWYETHYHPNNAILIVAGDADPDEVRALAEEHYGPIPANPDIEPMEARDRPSEPPHIAERRVIYEDARVSNPYVSINFLAPERNAGDQEEAAALTLLAEILAGSGFTSVLPREMQIEDERSLFVGAYYGGTSLDTTTFTLINMPLPGTPLEEAEAEILAEIDEFLEEGIDPAQFERIQFQIDAARIYEEDDVEGLASVYGRALTSGLTVADVQAWPDILAATTVDDVMDAARDVFSQGATTTGYLLRPSAPETDTETAGEVSQ
ncbi:M16 family metallopeptidase [Jannaschia sp. CCS1]|uniref:M16 family metallopeptidase n=1 Tax=Jannaschia sp. (strain CCS1) TaxID=290400 RepID=UPI000053D3D8|nr:pitrilysin family protein [Jannaschia sp. CCS1]ABD56962.1 peptidase M16-like protein [Jannaschia sp. CCS1]